MINCKNKKIYIVSSVHKTGGPKSLHQLANVLKLQGHDVHVVYCNGKDLCNNRLLYEDCSATVAKPNEIVDEESTVLLVPEIYTGILKKYNNVVKVVWWLSLDYYFLGSALYGAKHAMHKRNISCIFFPVIWIYKCLFQRYYSKKMKSKEEFKHTYHLYNCEYEKEFLLKRGAHIENMHYLCGPLEEEFLNILDNAAENRKMKRDIVAYNPAKMNMKYFEKIKKFILNKNTNIDFVPIQNMSRDEVRESLRQAKVYVDFGYFPGPERMPREAAALQCNIVTSKVGSAANDIDVPIPSRYKMELKQSQIKSVADKILDMIYEYEEYVDDFEAYREKVRNQILYFHNDILEIFEE